MSLTDVTPAEIAPADLADDAVALVRRWLAESRSEPVDAAATRLAGGTPPSEPTMIDAPSTKASRAPGFEAAS